MYFRGLENSPAAVYANSPECYQQLLPSEKAAVLLWIKLTFAPASTRSKEDSYYLKHCFQYVGEHYGWNDSPYRYCGFYLTNGQFKGAMLDAGYQPTKPKERNWSFKVKPKRRTQRATRVRDHYAYSWLTAEEFMELVEACKLANDDRTAWRQERRLASDKVD